ncbi:phage/plasmid primase, P4 family [Clostridium novyi]|uniref:Putative primase n=1 Tax=Clostridium novyi (strain NT) TaxID=386415 RepID=A0Q3S8_CLONN|nr:phage/plasmid primase, P4 family [Clostridium novyi]ABK62668.1 putative primase [Clostridium novyi NT]KEH85291.1 DNA primase [Clostridium novyi A str. NCTC 538]
MGNEFNIMKNLFPRVPLVNYSKIPIIPWKDENNWVNNIDAVQSLGSIYKKEINGETKGGQLTGYSLLCGKTSNIIVIDIDVNHGDSSIDGIQNFKEFIKEFSNEDKKRILNTFVVITPRGGMHLYFKYKEGLKNKANYIPGVDVRTDGGLIVLPGSQVKVDGEILEYKANGKDIQYMPQVLFDKLLKLDKPSQKKETSKKIQKDFKADKYYKPVKEGEGRDNTLISWLGYMIKNNPNMRTKEALLPQAVMYNRCWFEPPLSFEIVEKKIESVIKYALPSYCDEKGHINNWALVQYIIKEQPSYTKGNLWFIYDTEKGFYKYMELREVQKMYFKYALNDKDKTVTRSKNFAELLMLNSSDARDIHDEKKYINCLNGIIDIESDELLPHDPKYKTEIQFQANYISEWKDKFNNSEFKKFLDTTLDEGSITTLQESWGLMLSPHSREVQNCFIYKGEGSNGKSATFDIQEALIKDNKYICSIGLGDFGEPFVISMAEGKHVNIVRDDELSGKTVNKFFKSMVCGEPILVNRKNKDLVRLGFNMTMFFGLNRLPSAADKSTGFFRRPIIIPFNVSFGTEKEVKEGTRDKLKDTQLADRIIQNELDLVFMWAYEGLKRVKSNKWKVTVSESSEQEMEEYRQEVDSSYAFFKEKLKIEPKSGEKILKDNVYNRYLQWCSESDITPMNKVQFGRQFKSFGVKEKVSNSRRYWIDICFIDLEEVQDGKYPFK